MKKRKHVGLKPGSSKWESEMKTFKYRVRILSPKTPLKLELIANACPFIMGAYS